MSNKEKKLLIVEDDAGLIRQLKWAFEEYDTLTAGNRADAIAALRSEDPAVVTLDLGLPPDPDGVTEGFAALDEILQISPHTKVIIASGHGEQESALRAIAMGAYDFYKKPIDPDELGLIIRRAYGLYDLEQENRRLADKAVQSPLENVVTASERMLKICRMVERVAPTDVSVTLLGASGTGKELLAQAIHSLGSRAQAPFVAINCAAIPENLIESELFGHEKGAFTGAIKQTMGKIELAQGGTLFLDEIGDLPLAMQVKLLRFLQERVIERVGGRKEIPIDVRVVCATHQNLEAMITEDSFREDLYYRLAEITIDIPPLAEREGDAVLLARMFLTRFAKKQKINVRGFSQDAVNAITAYSWPGNVRELENKVKRAVIMSEGGMLLAEDLGLEVSEEDALALNLKKAREGTDRKIIRTALGQTEGNISKAAKLLGISRPTFYDLLKQYDITV